MNDRVGTKAGKRAEGWDAVIPSSGFRCHESGANSAPFLLTGHQKGRAERKTRVQQPGAVRGPDEPSSST